MAWRSTTRMTVAWEHHARNYCIVEHYATRKMRREAPWLWPWCGGRYVTKEVVWCSSTPWLRRWWSSMLLKKRMVLRHGIFICYSGPLQLWCFVFGLVESRLVNCVAYIVWCLSKKIIPKIHLKIFVSWIF